MECRHVKDNVYKGKSVLQRTYGGTGRDRKYSSYSLTTSSLDGVSCQRHVPATFFPRGKGPGNHWTGGWVGSRAGLDTQVRGKILLPLPRIELRSPGRPVRSQTLYLLSYPDQILFIIITLICKPSLSYSKVCHYFHNCYFYGLFVKKFPSFSEPEGLLLWSQQPATGPCRDSIKPSHLVSQDLF
jgi:hypothetical protein